VNVNRILMIAALAAFVLFALLPGDGPAWP
jgi:hypothetical protein